MYKINDIFSTTTLIFLTAPNKMKKKKLSECVLPENVENLYYKYLLNNDAERLQNDLAVIYGPVRYTCSTFEILIN